LYFSTSIVPSVERNLKPIDRRCASPDPIEPAPVARDNDSLFSAGAGTKAGCLPTDLIPATF
jgi:hypothetical protein